MYLFFIILMVVAAILMCIIVLIQNSKGGGLASSFSSSNAIMGVRKTTDILEKTTWGLAACIVIMSIAIAYVTPSPYTSQGVMIEQAQQEDLTNPYNFPETPAIELNNESAAEEGVSQD